LRIGWYRWRSYGRFPVHQSRHWLQCSFSCRKVVHYTITSIHGITTTQRDTKTHKIISFGNSARTAVNVSFWKILIENVTL
jgi:hypothetical protein